MTHEVSPSPLHLTQRGKRVRAAALLGGALALSYSAYGIATSGPAYPDCIMTTDVAVPEGGTLWGVATETVPNVDPREVIDAIAHSSNLSSSTVYEGQTLQVPTPDTIHCEP